MHLTTGVREPSDRRPFHFGRSAAALIRCLEAEPPATEQRRRARSGIWVTREPESSTRLPESSYAPEDRRLKGMPVCTPRQPQAIASPSRLRPMLRVIGRTASSAPMNCAPKCRPAPAARLITQTTSVFAVYLWWRVPSRENRTVDAPRSKPKPSPTTIETARKTTFAAAQWSKRNRSLTEIASRIAGDTARSLASTGSPRKRRMTTMTMTAMTMTAMSAGCMRSPLRLYSMYVLERSHDVAWMCYKRIIRKIVDPVQRREAIADALFAIVADRGFAKISLRAIAEESGLAIGSIRHYFTTAEGIVRFALETLVERVSARLEDRLASLLPRLESGALGRDEAKEETVDLLAELLPLDEIRRRESVVWLAFEEAARTDPALSDVFETSARGSRQLMARTVESMSRRGVLRADLDLELEVDLLAALVDGLTLRSTLHPEVLAPERAREVLAAHLEGLRRGSD